MTRTKIWLDATRPKTLPAAVAPVIIGSAMAFHDQMFHFASALATIIAALLIQIGTNFANDYFDHKKGVDTEKRLGPTRATQAGLVSPSAMKTAFLLTFLIAFLIGLFLVYRAGWPILLIGIFSILFGILYTGGPYPLGYNGLGDIFVLFFFGPVAVGGTYYVQSLEINSIVLLSGIAPGLISTAILTINNLRDIHTDAKAGKRTLVVRFGVGFAKTEYLASLTIAFFFPLLLVVLTKNNFFSLLTVLIFFPSYKSIKSVLNNQIGKALNNVLANTGRALFLYSIVFSIGWNI